MFENLNENTQKNRWEMFKKTDEKCLKKIDEKCLKKIDEKCLKKPMRNVWNIDKKCLKKWWEMFESRWEMSKKW